MHNARCTSSARPAGESDGAFTKGSQWLVWKFESDATLGDALDGRLGAFPACLEEFVLGRVNPNTDPEKRDTQVRPALDLLASTSDTAALCPELLF